MKRTAFAIALLFGSAAFAQTANNLPSDISATDPMTADAMTDDSLAADASLADPAVAHGSIAAHAYHGDGTATAAFETETNTSLTSAMPVADELVQTAASGSVVQPGNQAPERDARGIAVLSDAALVPAGWNGTAGSAGMGGPLLDPATGEAVGGDQTYPACTATVTDNCLQTYERQGR